MFELHHLQLGKKLSCEFPHKFGSWEPDFKQDFLSYMQHSITTHHQTTRWLNAKIPLIAASTLLTYPQRAIWHVSLHAIVWISRMTQCKDLDRGDKCTVPTYKPHAGWELICIYDYIIPPIYRLCDSHGLRVEEKWMSLDDTLFKKLIKHVQYACSLPVCIIMSLCLLFIEIRLQSKRNRGIRSREFKVKALHLLLHEKLCVFGGNVIQGKIFILQRSSYAWL